MNEATTIFLDCWFPERDICFVKGSLRLPFYFTHLVQIKTDSFNFVFKLRKRLLLSEAFFFFQFSQDLIVNHFKTIAIANTHDGPIDCVLF